jgi:hypothetical protein
VQAAREAGARLVIASMAFDRHAQGRHRTMMGSRRRTRRARRGSRGGIGRELRTSMGRRFRGGDAGDEGRRETPIIIQSNAGQPELVDGRAVYG